MKKVLTLIAAASLSAAASAESFNVVCGDVTYSYKTDKTGDMTFTGGELLDILGRSYQLSDITSMYVTDTDTEDNTVTVNYNGDKATVTVDGNVAAYLQVDVQGANVSIEQSSEVGDKTCGEITYQLSGASTNGSFYTTGSYKASIDLLGLTLTNPAGAPIDIQNGKRIKLSVKEGTTNVITDGTGGSQKGCLVCKGHLEIKGKGSLEVNGNTAHAIYAKEYITLKNATITVNSAVKDGLNCNQYFSMESGTLTIAGVGDDGIQVSYKDDTDREAEDTGSITISGGTINATATATAAKAIKADGDITVTDGTIIAKVTGGGKWDSSAVKTKAASCFGADGNMTIDGGELQLTATGGGGKGISIDGDLLITGGTLTISTTGGMVAYVNNSISQNYTGNSDNLASDYKSSPKGIKADGNITINGGTINVTTTGNGGEGIESKAVMNINGGTITAHTYDDTLNSSSHMYINGGTITAIATNNDAIDANGNLYITGGYTMALGPTQPEGGIDANEEEGYSVIFTGGTLLAVGGKNSTPTTTASTQAYVSASLSASANSTVTIKSGSTELASFTIPSNYSSSSQGGNRPGGGPGGNSSGTMIITCPDLTSGSSYTVSNGSSSTTATATLRGSSSGRPW